jgi:hypothetical protein
MKVFFFLPQTKFPPRRLFNKTLKIGVHALQKRFYKEKRVGRARARVGFAALFLGLAFLGATLLGVLFALLGVLVPDVRPFLGVALAGVLAGVDALLLFGEALEALFGVSLPFLGVVVLDLLALFGVTAVPFLLGDTFSSVTKSTCSSLAFLFFVALNLVGLVGLRSTLVRITLGAVLGAFRTLF